VAPAVGRARPEATLREARRIAELCRDAGAEVGVAPGPATRSMSVDCFLDTNVPVYAISSAEAEAPKSRKALDLVQHSNFGLSAQELQEFYVTVMRMIRRPLSSELAVALMDEYRAFPMVPTDHPLLASSTLSSRPDGRKALERTDCATTVPRPPG
jgi:predicted nucleic acid-binding protein